LAERTGRPSIPNRRERAVAAGRLIGWIHFSHFRDFWCNLKLFRDIRQFTCLFS
jgi:hypothetical protein